MSRYVVINSDGTNSFYDSDVNTIPSGALSITDADYNTFFSNQGSYIFTNVNGVATLTALTDIYFATNYGLTITQSKSNVATPTGAVRFSSAPTTAVLTAAFPSTAAQKTFTILTNAVSGDTITVEKQTLIAGTNFAVGSTIAATVTNIVTYLKSLPLITGNYNITSTDTSFTLTERFAGGGLTIADATYTGTVVVTSTSVATSVWGYTTQVKHNKKVALKEEYDADRLDYRDSYFGALVDGKTTLATTILTEAATLKTNLYTALEAINDE